MLDEAERSLARPLPRSVRALYAACDGFEVLDGNLVAHPLQNGPFALTRYTALLRASGWHVPEDVVAFGTNGGGEKFGFFCPSGERLEDTVIVEIAELFDARCMGVVGTSLARFLRSRTAFYALGAHPEVLDRLELPATLRSGERSLAEISRWSDPALPFDDVSAYAQKLDGAGLDHHVRALLPRALRTRATQD